MRERGAGDATEALGSAIPYRFFDLASVATASTGLGSGLIVVFQILMLSQVLGQVSN